jgi:membrane protein insertase Oxa1/YidC/SpoIIIJ
MLMDARMIVTVMVLVDAGRLDTVIVVWIWLNFTQPLTHQLTVQFVIILAMIAMALQITIAPNAQMESICSMVNVLIVMIIVLLVMVLE